MRCCVMPRWMHDDGACPCVTGARVVREGDAPPPDGAVFADLIAIQARVGKPPGAWVTIGRYVQAATRGEGMARYTPDGEHYPATWQDHEVRLHAVNTYRP